MQAARAPRYPRVDVRDFGISSSLSPRLAHAQPDATDADANKAALVRM